MFVRKRFVYPLLLVFFLQLFSLVLWADSPCLEKKIIGQKCWVHVEELDLDYLARVDTGASATSIHATDFLIKGGGDDPRDNIGKTINFLTISTDDQYKRLDAEVAQIQTVVSAQGCEKRYMVWLTMTANGISKKVLVNLRDRSHLKYKLLLGRDWLRDDFLVDVDLEEELIGEEGQEE